MRYYVKVERFIYVNAESVDEAIITAGEQPEDEWQESNTEAILSEED